MRRTAFSMALAVPLAMYAAPTNAFDRLPKPEGGVSAVTRVADLDRRVYRGGTGEYSHWRHRAAYVRWMHNEYVRAGYPVRHRQFRIYQRDYVCCSRRRHW